MSSPAASYPEDSHPGVFPRRACKRRTLNGGPDPARQERTGAHARLRALEEEAARFAAGEHAAAARREDVAVVDQLSQLLALRRGGDLSDAEFARENARVWRAAAQFDELARRGAMDGAEHGAARFRIQRSNAPHGVQDIA